MQVLTGFLNQPVAIDGNFIGSLGAWLKNEQARMDAVKPTMKGAVMSIVPWYAQGGSAPDYETVDGAAIIKIHGVLGWEVEIWGQRFGLSYGRIANQVRSALADDNVSKVILDINSPGGLATGLTDIAEELFASSQRQGGAKPIIAMIDNSATSAAYWLAATADEIVLSSDAIVGSVGVYTMHVDQSKFWDQMGIDLTLIFSGKHKVDGNSYEPLPEDIRASYQVGVDALRTDFATAVGRMRGMTPEAVLATEAAIYSGEDAVSVGFADHVGNLRAAFSDNEPEVSASSTATASAAAPSQSSKEFVMTNPEETAAVETVETKASKPTTASKPIEAAASPVAPEADLAAVATARAVEIMGCEEAQGQQALATKLAANPLINVDDAKAMLTAATGSTGDPLGLAMADVDNPDIGDDAGENVQSFGQRYAEHHGVVAE